MTTLSLHDCGWLALASELRQRLDLRTGDRLEIEIVEGGLWLRPAGRAVAFQAAPPALAPAVEDPLPAKRGRGRPRKQVPADQAMTQPQAELPPVKVRTE
jgi:bifunctional DNA-binding transcriptional regulator/antitoxin component of YhaV-PrlF toxin-antitoxin module